MKSISVIRARLLASEDTLCSLWQLMAHPYSELIATLLEYISNHPDFSTWLEQCRLPNTLIKDYVKTLKTESPYQDLPGRFRDSAVILVTTIYKSWFAVKKRKLFSLQGKKRFLAILKSDEELQQDSGYDLYTLTREAEKLLQDIQAQLEQQWQEEQTRPIDEEAIFWQVTNHLYSLYDQTKSVKKRSVIAYLIKNNHQLPNQPEDPQAYQLRRQAKVIQIQRLEKQLKASAPHPRILDERLWLEALNQSLRAITEVNDLEQIQQQLLLKFPHLPYPVFYNSNIDLYWSLNDQERICLTFNGLKSKNVLFELTCDRRQLPYFQRILYDYQSYRREDISVPAGLLLLRSAQLIWKPATSKGEPWNNHHLYLHCSIDQCLWSQGGIEQARQELVKKTQQTLVSCQAKEKETSLTPHQKRNIQRLETSLEKLKTFDTKHLNPTQSHNFDKHSDIIIGVSFGLKIPVTLAIINIRTKANLGFLSPRQLLSRTQTILARQSSQRKKRKVSDYQRYLNYLQQRHDNQHQRHKAQKKFADNQFAEANTGRYFSRLFANSIIEIARTHQAHIIVVSNLKNIREVIEAEVRARAELKYPGNKDLQQKYAQNFRSSVNQWNYNQLTQCISRAALKVGIEVTSVRQNTKGTPQQKSRQLVLNYLKSQQETAQNSDVEYLNNQL
ncbi:MAG: type V CRISPR-associated protein Cas12k [Crocosphaera sp.]|nr:type V CRISPR-associated protein Cas12k [Crocosphaera sp.]